MSIEFYQGITIKILKTSGGWTVFIDGEKDATLRTKKEARNYIDTCIKTR